MHEEDDLARTQLAKFPAREEIARRLEELAHHEDRGLPVRVGGMLFYERRDADRDRGAVYVKGDADGIERVLLDPDAWAADKSLSLGDWVPSWDGKKVAYSVCVHNRDAGTLHVIDVGSGTVSQVDVIEGVENAYPQWTPNGDGFYYHKTPQDPALRAKRHELEDIRFHRLGTSASADIVVRRSAPGQTGVRPVLSHDGRWLFAKVWRGESRVDLYFEDLREPRPTWRTLVAGRDALYDVRIGGDTFFVRSEDEAPNGQVFAVSPAKPAMASWRKIIPERSDVPLMGFDLLGGGLILRYRKDDIAHVEIHRFDGSLVRELPLHGVGTTTFPSGTPISDEAYYGFWSYDRPMEIYRTSISKGGDTLWYQAHVAFDRERIAVEQVFFASKDGTRVPMFLVHPRDTKRSGHAPTMLYGYGGFAMANVPWFDPKIIPWVERGGLYALASLRGGNDYGEAWHRAGVRRNKQNVFDDFSAAAEYLVREGYTTPDRLVAIGASNGGLLVAAAITQRPDLFRAAICGEPITDMVRFPVFGPSQIPEFGDPANADDFRALFAYSPYHHVTPGVHYPWVLITTSVHDDRADPAHARKFAAALQAATTGGPVLLRVDWHAGHHGEDSVTNQAEKDADALGFALDAVGAGGP